MFKAVTIKQSQDLYFDLGRIAESILFYENVNLVCNPSFFHFLLNHSEIDSFLELVNKGLVNVYLENDTFGNLQNLQNNKLIWSYPVIATPQEDVSIRLERVIFDTTKRSGYSRRITKQIVDKSNKISLPKESSELVVEDLQNQVYLKRAISYMVKDYDSSININPEEITVNTNKVANGYLIKSNVDFKKINNRNINKYPIDEQSLLFKIFNARIDSLFASKLNSDIITSPIITSLINEVISESIERSIENSNQINLFTEITLYEGKRISEVIYSRERNLSDFIKLLDKSKKFQNWVFNIDEGENILREYNKAITEKSWLDKLPVKTLRWSFFTGTSLVLNSFLPGSGAVLSAGNRFLLDKIAKGWKPNSFINNDLKKFLKN